MRDQPVYRTSAGRMVSGRACCRSTRRAAWSWSWWRSTTPTTLSPWPARRL